MKDTNMQAADEKMTPASEMTPAEKLKAAEDLCADLNMALRAVGIKLPSLWVEPLGYADLNPAPLIELGRCTPDTARALLAVLRTAQTAQTAGEPVALATA